MVRVVPRRNRQAFTLIELMIVVSIILVLSVLAVPSIRSINAGSALTRGTQIIDDQLSLARQMAETKNRDVQVRFIRLTSDPVGYRALQLWGVSHNNITKYEPIGRVIPLPDGVMIAEQTTISPLLNNLPVNSTDLFPTLSQNQLNYLALRFLPNGSTDLPVTLVDNYMTLISTRYATTSSLPTNYAIIQISPDGHVNIYRP